MESIDDKLMIVEERGSVWFDVWSVSNCNDEANGGITQETIMIYASERLSSSGLIGDDGKFTAPIAGAYEFKLYSRTEGNNYDYGTQNIKIFKNDAVIAGGLDEDGDDIRAIGISAILNLDLGDEVWATTDARLPGSKSTHFTGKLILP